MSNSTGISVGSVTNTSIANVLENGTTVVNGGTGISVGTITTSSNDNKDVGVKITNSVISNGIGV